MSKNTTTISISVPTTIAEQLDRVSLDMGVSRSSICTAIISVVLKWDLLKELVKHGKA